MVIREAKKSDYEQLAKLYSFFFTVHNIFHQDSKPVIDYLKKQEQEMLVFEENKEIKGAICLVNLGQSLDGKHKHWKFRHFAYLNEKIGEELLAEAEKKVKAGSKTAKVELTIAETEKNLSFYKTHSYEQEGILKNHYRWGERCFVLGKSFS